MYRHFDADVLERVVSVVGVTLVALVVPVLLALMTRPHL